MYWGVNTENKSWEERQCVSSKHHWQVKRYNKCSKVSPPTIHASQCRWYEWRTFPKAPGITSTPAEATGILAARYV